MRRGRLPGAPRSHTPRGGAGSQRCASGATGLLRTAKATTPPARAPPCNSQRRCAAPSVGGGYGGDCHGPRATLASHDHRRPRPLRPAGEQQRSATPTTSSLAHAATPSLRPGREGQARAGMSPPGPAYVAPPGQKKVRHAARAPRPAGGGGGGGGGTWVRGRVVVAVCAEAAQGDSSVWKESRPGASARIWAGRRRLGPHPPSRGRRERVGALGRLRGWISRSLWTRMAHPSSDFDASPPSPVRSRQRRFHLAAGVADARRPAAQRAQSSPWGGADSAPGAESPSNQI
eukprot:scaffold1017_cov374-Prasinococcus_capsulatus_cf.AAC.6